MYCMHFEEKLIVSSSTVLPNIISIALLFLTYPEHLNVLDVHKTSHKAKETTYNYTALEEIFEHALDGKTERKRELTTTWRHI